MPTFHKAALRSLVFATLSILCWPAAAILANETVTSASSVNEPKQIQPTEDQDKPVEMWFRLVSVNIPEGSDIRTNFNDPPLLYVVMQGPNGKKTSTEKSGWSVTYQLVGFPEDNQNEVLISDSDKDSYSFVVWDNQLGRDPGHSLVTITGAELQRRLFDAAGGEVTNDSEVTLGLARHGTITLAYSGTQRWYRLRNVTIPPASPHRKALGRPGRIYVLVRRDGVQLGDHSSIGEGWSVDFPRGLQNSWPIREGVGRRYPYTVEVWRRNRAWRDRMIFNVTGLEASDFDKPILEEIDSFPRELVDERACRVEFERTPAP